MKPYYEHAGITIYHGDCRELIAETGNVSITFADPPYAVGLKYESHKDNELVNGWLDLSIKYSKVVIVTPGYTNLFNYPRPDYVAIRFDRSAQSPSTIAYINKWEPIFFYGKPDGKLSWDVIETNCHGERHRMKMDHPCPKPYGLISSLFAAFKGDSVRDPFMGTGTILRAAKDNGVSQVIGIEIEERYCEIAAKRLSQEVFEFA